MKIKIIWFGEKIKKDKTLSRHTKKWKKVQINKIRYARGSITIIPQKFKGSWETTVNNYTLTNWQPKRNREFLEIYNLLRLKQEENENLNRSITCKEIESVIKNLSTQKSPETGTFTGEFYLTIKEELIPILLKIFQKIK